MTACPYLEPIVKRFLSIKGTTMRWDDIENTIYDGTKAQVDALKCPDCGENISVSFCKAASPSENNSLRYWCDGCGMIVTQSTAEIPAYTIS